MTNDLTRLAFRIEDILATFWSLLNGAEDWIQGREARANPKSPLLAFFGRTLGRIQAQRDATTLFLKKKAKNRAPFRSLSLNKGYMSMGFDKQGLPSDEELQMDNALEGHDLLNDEKVENHELMDASQELEGTNDVAIKEDTTYEIVELEREDGIERAAPLPGISTRTEEDSTKNNER